MNKRRKEKESKRRFYAQLKRKRSRKSPGEIKDMRPEEIARPGATYETK